MRIGIVTKPELAAARTTLAELDGWLEVRHLDAVWSAEAAALAPPRSGRTVVPRERIGDDVSLVLVLGGDGTLLAVGGAQGPGPPCALYSGGSPSPSHCTKRAWRARSRR